MIEVKFKRLHPDAVLPTYAQPGDAGMDLVARRIEYLSSSHLLHCRFGFAMEIPSGYVGLIFPRSSIFKKSLSLTNSVGVIDSGYRGEVSAYFKMDFHVQRMRYGCEIELAHPELDAYSAGDRIAQLIVLPIPQVQAVWAEELSDSVRGTGGFGSTGA